MVIQALPTGSLATTSTITTTVTPTYITDFTLIHRLISDNINPFKSHHRSVLASQESAIVFMRSSTTATHLQRPHILPSVSHCPGKAFKHLKYHYILLETRLSSERARLLETFTSISSVTHCPIDSLEHRKCPSLYPE